jgi:hypothetical protein
VASWDGWPRSEVVPELNAQFKAGLCQPEETVAAIATSVAAGPTTDLAPRYLTADVIFRSVGVERDLGAVEHHEQLGFLFVEAFEQAVERDESGLEREDAIEPRQQDGLAALGRTAAVRLQSAVVLPDQVTDVALGRAVFVGKGVELANEPFSVHSTQSVLADVELTGVVADDHGVRQKAVGFDAAPQRPFGGDQHRVRIDLEGADAELILELLRAGHSDYVINDEAIAYMRELPPSLRRRLNRPTAAPRNRGGV